MQNWGYTVNRDNQIDFEINSKSIFDIVVNAEPSFTACIACGSCAATCSAGNFTNLSLRNINIQIARGETQSLITEIKKCMLCGKCMLVCPRGVNTRNILKTLKELIN
jgi:heterodisulfide reductase subunit C